MRGSRYIVGVRNACPSRTLETIVNFFAPRLANLPQVYASFFFFFFFFVYPRFASLKETIDDLETHHFRMSTIRSISVSPYAEWEKSRLLPNDKQPFLNIIETGEVWL